MSKYLSVAETAKLVRQALKEAFPGFKFGVRSSKYAGGASINVNWADGPNERQVAAIVKTFEGAYFDGMQDYKGYTRALYKGEVTHFGADFIFTNRQLSDELRQRCIDVACERISHPPVSLEEYQRHHWHGTGTLVYRFASERMKKITDRFAQPSPTVQDVIYLGNDGYSEVGALRNMDDEVHA